MFLTCISVSSGQARKPSNQLAREGGILRGWGSEAQGGLAGHLSDLLMCIQFLCPFLVSFSCLCFWPWPLNLTFISVIIFSLSFRLSVFFPLSCGRTLHYAFPFLSENLTLPQTFWKPSWNVWDGPWNLTSFSCNIGYVLHCSWTTENTLY